MQHTLTLETDSTQQTTERRMHTLRMHTVFHSWLGRRLDGRRLGRRLGRRRLGRRRVDRRRLGWWLRRRLVGGGSNLDGRRLDRRTLDGRQLERRLGRRLGGDATGGRAVEPVARHEALLSVRAWVGGAVRALLVLSRTCTRWRGGCRHAPVGGHTRELNPATLSQWLGLDPVSVGHHCTIAILTVRAAAPEPVTKVPRAWSPWRPSAAAHDRQATGR